METDTKVRHVRTPAGAARYKKPIGSPIGPTALGERHTGGVRESAAAWVTRVLREQGSDAAVEAATFDPVPPKQGYGTDTRDADTFDKRLARCFELATKAAAYGAPDGSTLVNGSIQGFDNPRISHAWVELPDGTVWEPITRDIIDPRIWKAVYRPVEDVRYSRDEVFQNMAAFAHYGPWDAANPPAPKRH